MKLKPVFFLTMAVASLGLAIPLVQAQYTPDNGGVYVAPSTPGGPGIYIGPSTPSVPAPTPPQGPPQPGQPSYSWQVPPANQPTTVLQPTSPEAIRVVQPAPVMVQLSEAQVADLTASIALYPDPILAEMLPAATYVEELTYVDRWMAQHPGADEQMIASLPVNDAVKCIMHYPTVLTLMTDHVDWTQALGAAFLYQRQDVMESVQRWRATAVSNGYLYSNPQLEIIQQGAIIMIQPPARAQVVFVPVYDPAVVYVRPRFGPPPRNVITFGGGGFSLTFVENDVDWRDHQVRVPVHHDDRDLPPGMGRPGGPGGPGGGGRGPVPETKTVFVHDSVKPGVMYPQRIVTPQPDKKVVTIPAPQAGRGGGPGNGRGPGGGGPPEQNRGGADGNPNTPF